MSDAVPMLIRCAKGQGCDLVPGLEAIGLSAAEMDRLVERSKAQYKTALGAWANNYPVPPKEEGP
jgi:hypothetical protein